MSYARRKKKFQQKPKTIGGVVKVTLAKNKLLYNGSIKEEIMKSFNIRKEVDLSEIQFAIAHASSDANIEGILYQFKKLDFPVFGVVGDFSFADNIGLVIDLFDFSLVEDFDYQLVEMNQETLSKEIIFAREANDFVQHINLGFSFMEMQANRYKVIHEGKIHNNKMISIVLKSHTGKIIYY